MVNSEISSSPKDFFSKHAKAYTTSKSHAEGPDLARLREVIEPKSSDCVLDLATGTGFTAMEFALRVKTVSAVDITKEMILQARKLSENREVTNIDFVLSDVSSLPFSQDSFDLVVTRRATHHFKDIVEALSEANRVLKKGGRLGVVDMSPRKGSEDLFNNIERLRDSTHSIAFSSEDWKNFVLEAGFDIVHSETLDEELNFEKWLYPVKPGGAEEKAIRAELQNAPSNLKNLMGVREDSGKVLGWTKPRIVLIAEK